MSGTLDVRPELAAVSAGGAPPDAIFFALRVCVGASGRVDGARVEHSTSYSEGYARALQAAAATWQFTPFLAGGKPVRVCAVKQFASPKLQQPRRARPGHSPRGAFGGPPPNVAPSALDLLRIGGKPSIVPDDVTRTSIAVAGISKLIGAFKLCLSSSGRIRTVTQLKGTGVPAYDRKLIHDMKEGWRYRPFLVDGVPAQVCTAVTFIYAQR